MESHVSTDRTVLIIDDDAAAAARVARSLQGFGYSAVTAVDFSTAEAMNRRFRPHAILTELKLDGIWACDVLPCLKLANAEARTAIVTNYPSVATAIKAIRVGFDTYLVKPLTPPLLLEALGKEHWGVNIPETTVDDDGFRAGWPSLDRTIWEYINQVFVTAGTMSEAARRLRIDRRTLRRMLAKHPPMR
jgi:two-component system response regulator RegA